MKISEDKFYELKDSTQNLEEKMRETVEERNKLQTKLKQTEQELEKLETINERARELFAPSVNSEKKSDENICGICFEDFDDSVRKQKIFNPCGHVACNKCAPIILNTECHICRETVKNLIPYYG